MSIRFWLMAYRSLVLGFHLGRPMRFFPLRRFLSPLLQLLPLLVISSSFSASSSSSAASVSAGASYSEDGLAPILSSLWHMDSEHRRLFHDEFRIAQGEDGGRLVAVLRRPSVLRRPIAMAFGQLCQNFLQPANPNQSNKKSLQRVRRKVDSFLAELDKTPIFKKASTFYSAHSDAKSFKDKVRSLWFSSSADFPFGPLMCRFSASSGNWLSFLSHRPSEKRLVVERDGEDLALAEFVPNDAGAANATAVRANGPRQRRRFPLGDSVEFELSALTLCALLGSEQNQRQKKLCTFSLGAEKGQMELTMSIEVQISHEGGDEPTQRLIPRAFAFAQLRGDGPPPTTITTKLRQSGSTNKTIGRSKSMPSLGGPANLQQLVDRMWEQDTDRVNESVLRVDWQEHIPRKSVVDVSTDPFLSVSDEFFLQRPIYAALVDIFNEQLFHPPVCQGEPSMSAQRRAKFDRFWALITRSDIFRTAFDYLDRLGKVDGLHFDAFTRRLFDRWFGAYTRCGTCKGGKCSGHEGPLGSSGWEHVFSGEWRGDIVDGHHSWVRFYLQEKAGDIEYHGYYAKPRHGNFIGTIQYKWKHYLKRIGGFLIGTSPAFDFSLLTVCILSEPGDRKCKFEMNETPMFVSSFLEDCVIDGTFKHNFCIATAYPGIVHSDGS